MVRPPIRRLIVGTMILGAGLAVGACSSSEPTAEPEPADPRVPGAVEAPAPESDAPEGPAPQTVQQLITDALQRDGNITYRQLLSRLGAPGEVDRRPVTNAYDPRQVDTLRTLRYPGLVATVYDVAREPKTFLIRLALSSTRYRTPEGLRVGVPADAVVEQIGRPTERRKGGDEWVYAENKATPTAMIVEVDDGRVATIAWEFYFS